MVKRSIFFSYTDIYSFLSSIQMDQIFDWSVTLFILKISVFTTVKLNGVSGKYSNINIEVTKMLKRRANNIIYFPLKSDYRFFFKAKKCFKMKSSFHTSFSLYLL